MGECRPHVLTSNACQSSFPPSCVCGPIEAVMSSRQLPSGEHCEGRVYDRVTGRVNQCPVSAPIDWDKTDESDPEARRAHWCRNHGPICRGRTLGGSKCFNEVLQAQTGAGGFKYGYCRLAHDPEFKGGQSVSINGAVDRERATVDDTVTRAEPVETGGGYNVPVQVSLKETSSRGGDDGPTRREGGVGASASDRPPKRPRGARKGREVRVEDVTGTTVAGTVVAVSLPSSSLPSAVATAPYRTRRQSVGGPPFE